MKRPRTEALALLLGLAGCQAEQPPKFGTEHLYVEPSDNDVVCQGTLANMEAQVVRVAGIVGFELNSRIVVYYGPSAVEEHCGSESGGCARDLGEVAASGFSSYHELVHAIRQLSHGGIVGNEFFEEGLAVVLSGFRPIPYIALGDAMNVERGPSQFATDFREDGDFTHGDYPVAAHFVSWLRTEWGDEVLVPFLNDERYLTTEGIDIAFAEHFGLSIDEADSAWRATSAEEYRWGEVCDPARDLAWSGATLDFVGEVACDLDTTLGPGPRPGETILTRSNCFMLDDAATLRAEFASPAGRVTFANVECEPVGGLTPEHFQRKYLSPGEALELPFAPCQWEIMVETALAEPIEFSVRLTRL